MYRDSDVNVESVQCDTKAGYAQQGTPSTYRASLKDEAAKSAQFHSDEAIKAARAHSFLATHPEFDEFIQLIRAGTIRI
jgi:predicted Zn-dependent protease